MKIAIHYGNFTHPGGDAAITSALRDAAQAADEGGIARFTLMDHYLQLPQTGPPTDAMLEGYTTLGWLAAVTRRIEIGLLVTGVTYRHPGLLAKIIATLDTLSDGRAFLGIGAAWFELEHDALGVTFPPLPERLRRVEETVQICRQMWSDDDGPYRGRYYSLDATICTPRPRRQIPVLIGGGGEKITLRQVARYADACNLLASTPVEAAHKLSVLTAHCDAVGRDPAQIEKTLLTYDRLTDLDAFVTQMGQYAALGFDLVEIRPDGPDPVRFVERVVTDVAPRLAAL